MYNYVKPLLFFTAFQFVLAFDLGLGPTVKKVHFYTIGALCPKHKNDPWIFNAQRVWLENGNMYLNYTITGKEDAPRIVRIVINIQRCINRESLDTCENFYTFRHADLYKLVGDPNSSFKSLYSTLTPKVVCPLKKGVYTAKNAYLNISAFLLFPADDWVWKVVARVLDGNRVLVCTISEAKVSIKH